MGARIWGVKVVIGILFANFRRGQPFCFKLFTLRSLEGTTKRQIVKQKLIFFNAVSVAAP